MYKCDMANAGNGICPRCGGPVRNCVVCGRMMDHRRSNKLTCSEICRKAKSRIKLRLRDKRRKEQAMENERLAIEAQDKWAGNE